MATIGMVEPFDTEHPENWNAYAERVDFFLEANGITTDGDKRAAFLSICGPTTIAGATTAKIVCRFKFHQRRQQPGEGMAKFINALRNLGEGCNFGSVLNDMIRDRIVCGVVEESLQQRLLAKETLTLDVAQATALAFEAAARNVSDLRGTPDGFLKKIDNRKEMTKLCFRCDESHSSETCRFKTAVCRFCGKMGHIERACLRKKRNRGSKRSEQVKAVASDNDSGRQNESDSEEGTEYSIHRVSPGDPGKLQVKLLLNSTACCLEVDSGAAYTVISASCFNSLRRKPNLERNTIILRDYQGNMIETLGTGYVRVEYKNVHKTLPVIVIKGTRVVNLLGRNWFEPLNINVSGINQVHNAVLNNVIQTELESEFAEVFDGTLGVFRGPPISLNLPRDVNPIVCKVRKVPFALRPLIEDELDRLQQQGVIEPVTHPRWATPIVPVVKASNEIRLCADYRITVNKVLRPETYPIPNVQDMLANLAGGRVFAKLDLTQAYQQLTVDDEAAEAQTIITHKGAFRVKRLQFGISNAPQIFQQLIDQRLQGIPGVMPYFDDILVVAKDEAQLLGRLREVLTRFREDGLKLKKAKCVFNVHEIEFLGHKISSRGLEPAEEKIQAIIRAPAPSNVTELQAFLGLVNFYGPFLESKATIAEPLHKLLHKNVTFRWGRDEAQAFGRVKSLLTKKPILCHYHEGRKLILTVDASSFGVGMVLSQPQENGREAPIAFHSRTLSKPERNFAQVDKEALAIMVGVTKFHNYIFGRKVEIRTDHKPLLGILGENKHCPNEISPRMLRWRYNLSAYDYNLVHVAGKKIPHADALCRLPLPTTREDVPRCADVLMFECVEESPVSAQDVARQTAKDPVLARVRDFALSGWPTSLRDLQSDIKPYWTRRNDITSYRNCLLTGTRVIIPPGERKRILQVLHEAHPGIIRMKALARSYVWWPGVDSDIEDFVAKCEICQQHRHMPPKAPIHPWEFAREPWQRIHVDHAGPVNGNYFLLVVDSYSKWLEMRRVPSLSSTTTIQVLREIFATHGLPDVIVSDNGTAFTSEEFKLFAKKNGCRAVNVAPYKPSSNGQAERMVQFAKDSLKKMGKGDVETRISRFLLAQHATPCTTTGQSPAELLMGRRITTALDRIKPSLTTEMDQKRDQLLGTEVRSFKEGQHVGVRSYVPGDKWIPAQVMQKTGPVSYKVQTPEGKLLHRHSNQMVTRPIEQEVPGIETSSETDEDEQEAIPERAEQPMASPEGSLRAKLPSPEGGTTPRPSTPRPERNRRPPRHLQDYECAYVKGEECCVRTGDAGRYATGQEWQRR
ncbi:uncharacterized protein K02A2.6-like [Photinus pyralis]|nr:uncharacterized protein K02A2.6-like [Photinus pyralis]